MSSRTVYEEVLRYLVETEGGRELTTLASQLTALGDSGDKSAGQAAALATELQRLQDTTGKLKDFTRLKASITETGIALDDARTRMASLGAEVDKAGTPTKKLQRDLARAAAEVEKLSKQQNRQQVELQKTSGALRAAGIDTDKLADASDRLQGELADVAQRGEAVAGAARKAGRDTRAAAGGVDRLDRAAGGSAKSLASMAMRLNAISAAVSVALRGLATLSGTAIFSGGLKSAMELESALAEVQAVSGATAEELEAMKAAAEAGGAATKFSTLEAAQGLGELARATGDAQTAIDALPAALLQAQAAGLGVAESATIITTTLSQFGLSASEAMRAADVLSKAANITEANVQGLGNALTYAAPQAALLGMDLETTAAALAGLAKAGYQGERAGVALRNVFGEMMDPTSNFARALRELGIDSTNFVDVVDQLAEKGAEGQKAIMSLDAAARPAILALVSKGGAALRQFETDMRNSAGSAAEAAKVMGDSLGGAAEKMKDTFDRTRRSLIEPLLEPLKNELTALAEELEAFAQSPEFAEIKIALKEAFIEGAAAARELFEEVDFSELARSIKSALSDADGTVRDFADQLGIVVRAVVLIGQSFAVVFNTVQAAILGIATLVSKLASMFLQVQGAITAPMRSFLEFIGVIQEGQGDLSEFAGGMGAVADEFGGRFLTNVDEAWKATQRLTGTATEAGQDIESGLGRAATAADRAKEANSGLAESSDAAAGAMGRQAEAATSAAGATDEAGTKAARAQAKLAAALDYFGLRSQEELDRSARAAKDSFETIRDAFYRGEASIDDARRAYERYAASARAAVADAEPAAKARVEAELEVLAAVLGVNDALDKQTDGYRGLKDTADNAAKSVSQTGASAQQSGSSMEKSARKTDGLKVALQGMSDAAVQSLLKLNKLAGTRLWAQAWNRVMGDIDAQRMALSRLNDELDRQLAALDPLAERVRKLQGQYAGIDDDTIRNIAAKEEQVDQALKRKRDEALQERQRILDEAQAEADRGQAGPARATAGAARSLGTVRIELPTGDHFDVPTTEAGADNLQAMLDALARAQSNSQLRRRT